MFAFWWTLEFFIFEKSDFCYYVIWRYSGTTKFQLGQFKCLLTYLQSNCDLRFQYLHRSALNLIFGIFDFAWARDSVGGWHIAEMKGNFILHLLIPMRVFKMVCKLVKIYFEVLRGRSALRRLEKIDFPEIPTIVQSLLYLMVYESWGMSHGKPL